MYRGIMLLMSVSISTVISVGPGGSSTVTVHRTQLSVVSGLRGYSVSMDIRIVVRVMGHGRHGSLPHILYVLRVRLVRVRGVVYRGRNERHHATALRGYHPYHLLVRLVGQMGLGSVRHGKLSGDRTGRQ